MQGLSSYDVLDSTEFSNAKKIEQRLARYDKRNKKRQVELAQKRRAVTMAQVKSMQAISGKLTNATDVELTAALDKLKPEECDII